MTWSFLPPVRSVSINPAFIVYHNTLSLQHCARTGIDTTRFIECNTETGRYIISGGGQEACHDIKILADHTQNKNVFLDLSRIRDSGGGTSQGCDSRI